jgi:hypothetical protein
MEASREVSGARRPPRAERRGPVYARFDLSKADAGFDREVRGLAKTKKAVGLPGKRRKAPGDIRKSRNRMDCVAANRERKRNVRGPSVQRRIGEIGRNRLRPRERRFE